MTYLQDFSRSVACL